MQTPRLNSYPVRPNPAPPASVLPRLGVGPLWAMRPPSLTPDASGPLRALLSTKLFRVGHVSPPPPLSPGPPLASPLGYVGGLLTPLPASARLCVCSPRSQDNSLKAQVTSSHHVCESPTSKSKPRIPLPLRPPLRPHPGSDSLASVPQAPGPPSLRVQGPFLPSLLNCHLLLTFLLQQGPPPRLPCLSLAPYPHSSRH